MSPEQAHLRVGLLSPTFKKGQNFAKNFNNGMVYGSIGNVTISGGEEVGFG
jgi:hypothetical protein